MASTATGGNPSRYRSQNPCRAACTAARSAANDASIDLGTALGALLTERPPHERSIGLLDQLRDARLGAGQLPARAAQALNPFLEQRQCTVEGDPVAVQLGRNFFQSG